MRVFAGVAVCLLVGSVAVADLSGPPVYFNFNSTLANWEPSFGNGNKVLVGPYDGHFWMTLTGGTIDRSVGSFKDIAFDADGNLFAVNVGHPNMGSGVDDGTFWRVNAATAEVFPITDKFLDLSTVDPLDTSDIGDKVAALANAGQGHFFAAANGLSVSATNDNGHLYEWFWNGTSLSGYDRGRFTPVANALFGNNTEITALGDLIYINGTLYGTVRANDGLQTGEAKFLLVSIDPTTAAVTVLANLDGWSNGTVNVGGQVQPKFVDISDGSHPTGNQFDAMVNYMGQVGLLRNDGFLFTWDGTVGAVDGSNIDWLTIDVGCNGIEGGTQTPVPVPAALPLGILGLAGLVVLGRKMRKLA